MIDVQLDNWVDVWIDIQIDRYFRSVPNFDEAQKCEKVSCECDRSALIDH